MIVGWILVALIFLVVIAKTTDDSVRVPPRRTKPPVVLARQRWEVMADDISVDVEDVIRARLEFEGLEEQGLSSPAAPAVVTYQREQGEWVRRARPALVLCPDCIYDVDPRQIGRGNYPGCHVTRLCPRHESERVPIPNVPGQAFEFRDHQWVPLTCTTEKRAGEMDEYSLRFKNAVSTFGMRGRE